MQQQVKAAFLPIWHFLCLLLDEVLTSSQITAGWKASRN
jgi:hypothetical protein